MQWRFYKDCMALTVLPRAQLFWVFWKMVTDDNKILGVFLEFSRVKNLFFQDQILSW